MADSAIKIFVEGGLEASLYGLGAEVSSFFLFCLTTVLTSI